MQNIVPFFCWFASALYVLIGSALVISSARLGGGGTGMMTSGRTFMPARICYALNGSLSVVPA